MCVTSYLSKTYIFFFLFSGYRYVPQKQIIYNRNRIYIYIQVVIILIYILNKNDLCVPIYIIYFAILKVISAVVCLINPLRYINF